MNQNYLKYFAQRIFFRSDITVFDLDILAKLLKVGEIKKEFLPNKELATGTLKDQRIAQFDLAGRLWGKDRRFWLDQEAQWLKEMREMTGSTQDDGKDDFKDVVSVQILTTIYAVVYDYYLFTIGEFSQFELEFALESANIALKQTVLKGLARSTVIDGKNMYTAVKNTGIRVGGSGLYLPDPAKNLPLLLSFFLPENINPDIYK